MGSDRLLHNVGEINIVGRAMNGELLRQVGIEVDGGPAAHPAAATLNNSRAEPLDVWTPSILGFRVLNGIMP
jgi:hypothetical protein